MFSRCFQDVCRIFPGLWTLKIQRNPMIPNYSMIQAAAIWWSPAILRSPAIWWTIRSMDFDNWKVYGDTSITDGLVEIQKHHLKLFDETNLFVFVHYLIYTRCIFSQNYLLCIISIVWYPMQYGKNAHRNNKSRWGRSQAMIGSSHPLYPPQEQMFVIFINIHLKRIFIFLRRI